MIMEDQIKAIFFDIGGTLVMKKKNKQRDLLNIQTMMTLLNETGDINIFISTLEREEKKYKAWSKQTLSEATIEDRWIRFLGSRYSESLIKANADKLQLLWGTSKSIKVISPDAATTLKELSRRGYLLGTISHTSPRFLEGTGIPELLTTTIYASKFGRRKPHPSLFLAAARECQVNPEECMYVGDRPSRDVIGSREAGIGRVVTIKGNGQEAETEVVPMQPDYQIAKLSELLELLPSRLDKNENKTDGTYFLYDAALSTMWGIKENVPLSRLLQNGRDLGFARFELNHNVSPEAFVEFDQNQFHIGSLHDPCPAIISMKELDNRDWLVTSLDESLRVKGVDVIKRTIEQAVTLCSTLVVIHPGRVVGDHSLDKLIREKYRKGEKGSSAYETLRLQLIADRRERGKPHLESLLKSVTELIEFNNNSGIMLGLENRLNYYELPIFDELQALLAAFTQPWVGWQLDVGHLQIHAALGLTRFDDWLNQFGERILGVHLHDVQGIDDHLSPGCGDVDFSKIAKFLPEFSYRTLEVDSKLSKEEIRSGMETLVATGCVSRI
jgi:HAD superfamily hydrolase (TIGR01509 family)